MRQSKTVSRRQFLQGSAAAAGGLALAGVPANLAFGQGSDGFRVGLIGCGGRGTDAAKNCVEAAAQANIKLKIVALADAFGDRLKGAMAALNALGKERADLTDERCFTGLDAYQKLLATDVNLVILATPPGFRPIHFEAAIQAGKNVFMEKPVAVDFAGFHSVVATSELAAEKKLAVVSGTQRRHESRYLETMKRILDGAIGEIVSAQCYWNQGGLWVRKREPGWSDVQWQLRNWLYFTWLSGDHIVEQHVHNIDVINWAMGSIPTKVTSMGGRQYRTGPEYGHIYDHFCTEFEYASGCRTISMCRQIDGAQERVSERVAGTKGASDCAGTIWDYQNNVVWKYEGPNANPYVLEHVDLLKSILAGTPLNEGKRIAESTVCSIMARSSAYAGMAFNTDWALKKVQMDLMPKNLTMDSALPVAPVARPGQYKLEAGPDDRKDDKKDGKKDGKKGKNKA